MGKNTPNKRRHFLKQAITLSAAAAFAPPLLNAMPVDGSLKDGDGITW